MTYCHASPVFGLSVCCSSGCFCVNCCKHWLVMCCLCGCVGANWWSRQFYSWLQPEAVVVWLRLGHQYNHKMRDRWDLGYGDLWIGTIVNWASAATGLDTIGMDFLNSVDKVCIVECRRSAYSLDLKCFVRLSSILPSTLSSEHSQ